MDTQSCYQICIGCRRGAWRLCTTVKPGPGCEVTPRAVSRHQALQLAISVLGHVRQHTHCYLAGTCRVTRLPSGSVPCPLAMSVFSAPQAVFLFSLIKYTPLKYNNTYVYPTWGYVLGWMMALSSMVCIPLYAIFIILRTKGPLKQVLRWWSLGELLLLPWLMGRAPGKMHSAHFSSEKARGREGGFSPEYPTSIAGNLWGLEVLSTASSTASIIRCPVFHETQCHHTLCNADTLAEHL